MDLTPGPEPICGEAGTYWLKGSDEPHFTAPCELAAVHEDPHDWAQHESAIHDEGYRAGREEAARCSGCDHLLSDHSEGGCWYSVSTAKLGANVVCVCVVERQ